MPRQPSGSSFDLIAIVNESTLVTAAQARAMAEAAHAQVRDDIAPAWDRKAVPVRFYASEKHVPDSAALGVLLDNSDQAGALGYHDETPQGRPYWRAFAKPSLDAGSSALAGAYAVSTTVTHEVAELIGDPACQTWVDDGAGKEYALELGDPVEADAYPLQTKAGPVLVTNFVFPAWFDPQASHSSTFDRLHRVSRPFQMTGGGYVLTRQGGTVTSTFGRDVPEWRRQAKVTSPVSRTHRRLAQAEHHRVRTAGE